MNQLSEDRFKSPYALGLPYLAKVALILFCSAKGGSWPIASISQFGPSRLLVEPDMTAWTGQAEIEDDAAH